jgi:hypothetical protein
LYEAFQICPSEIDEQFAAIGWQARSRLLYHFSDLCAPQTVLSSAPMKILIDDQPIDPGPIDRRLILVEPSLICLLVVGIDRSSKTEWAPMLFGQSVLSAIVNEPMTKESTAEVRRGESDCLEMNRLRALLEEGSSRDEGLEAPLINRSVNQNRVSDMVGDGRSGFENF